METVTFFEKEEFTEKLRSGKAVVRIESWDTNEMIGKRIRHYLEQAQGAPITVEYDVITDDMMNALKEFNPK